MLSYCTAILEVPNSCAVSGLRRRKWYTKKCWKMTQGFSFPNTGRSFAFFAFAHLHDMRRIREGKVGGRQESPTQCNYFLKRCFIGTVLLSYTTFLYFPQPPICIYIYIYICMGAGALRLGWGFTHATFVTADKLIHLIAWRITFEPVGIKNNRIA